ncbi:MAG: hypothetical protein IPN86_08710 [Saprospiraceae bacterium]|nr:hypothetical protein [Saprospiraceae bacterium]
MAERSKIVSQVTTRGILILQCGILREIVLEKTNPVSRHFCIAFGFLVDIIVFMSIVRHKYYIFITFIKTRQMNFMDDAALLERMICLMRRKSTGDADEFAEKLDMSKRSLQRLIQEMKEGDAIEKRRRLKF